jgi:hypothetical protein
MDEGLGQLGNGGVATPAGQQWIVLPWQRAPGAAR